MNAPFGPLHDIVIVTVNPTERLLVSGLVIPHVDDPDRQVADERDVGTVVAAGKGKKLTTGDRRPMSIAQGERVVFGRNKGQQIRHNEVDYTVLREEHLIGKLNGHGFEPLNDYVVAEARAKETTTDGGIVVPEFKDRDEATVIAVGPGKIEDDGTLTPLLVQVGDTILFNPRMAEPFQYEGRELLAMRQEHIVCVSNR
jgi:chaperonin GroES